MRKSSLVAVLLLALGAHACGLKGPLYLPEPAKEVTPSPEDKEKAEKEKEKKNNEQPASPEVPQDPPR